jgi:DNA adenine methylase
VLLRKARSDAEVYNDLDDEIVNVFRVLRDPVLAGNLRELCALTPWSRSEWLLSHAPSTDPVEQARRTIVRGFQSHGSMSRLACRSGFRARNVRQRSCAAVDWTQWPDQVPAFVERLAGVTIENRPALEVIAQQDSAETLFYVDPPYPISARTAQRWPSDIGKGYAHELSDEDHRTLASALHEVDGMVLVSGYHCPLTDELYADWAALERETVADGGKRRTEVLWLNPQALDSQDQRELDSAVRASEATA